jgi:anti-sigma B factor antagonist
MAIQDPPGEKGGAVQFRAEVQKGLRPLVVKLAGELDVATVPQLEACLEGLGGDGAPDICLDLSDLSFCDSSGIAAIVRAWQLVKGMGGQLSLASPQPAVRGVLEITGVLDYLQAPRAEEDQVRQ